MPPRLEMGGGLRSSRILIHPGSGGREKCWPLENFLALARRLCEAEQDIAFVIGPAEEERLGADPIRRLAAEFTLLRNLPLDPLAHEMSGARLVIANDSGPAHLAAATGTPTVVLFGPTTDPAVWRPLGEQVKVVGGGRWPEMSEVLECIRLSS